VDAIAAMREAFAGRSILVTGHTGFKGSWLAHWLTLLGAKVTGYALEPYTPRDNFVASRIGDLLERSVIGDVRDAAALRAAVSAASRRSCSISRRSRSSGTPTSSRRRTFEVNVVGAARVLDAVREAGSARAVVVITSDKCYRNVEQDAGYVESDTLGGTTVLGEQGVRGARRRDVPGLVLRAGRHPHRVRAGRQRHRRRRLVRRQDRPRRHPGAGGRRTRAGPQPRLDAPVAARARAARRVPASRGEHAAGARVAVGRVQLRTGRLRHGDRRELVDELVADWGAGSRTDVGHSGGHEAGLLALDCRKAAARLGWGPCSTGARPSRTRSSGTAPKRPAGHAGRRRGADTRVHAPRRGRLDRRGRRGRS